MAAITVADTMAAKAATLQQKRDALAKQLAVLDAALTRLQTYRDRLAALDPDTLTFIESLWEDAQQ